MSEKKPSGLFYVPESIEQEREDIKHLLKQPAGRRMFRRLLAATRVFEVSADGGDAGLERQEGMRRVGRWAMALLERAETGSVARLMAESAGDKK